MYFKDKEVMLLEPDLFENQVLQKMGTRCKITDFAILLGGSYVGKYTWYATRGCLFGRVHAISLLGNDVFSDTNNRMIGVRPVIYFDDLNEVMKNAKRNSYGVLETTYGEYPQFAAKKGEWLEKNYTDDMRTGKIYVTDGNSYTDRFSRFSDRKLEEYICDGTKYVRFFYDGLMSCELSNGHYVDPGKNAWVKVKPVVWYVDEEESRLISKYVLVAGIPFCNFGEYEDNFYKTVMYKFLNEHIIYDLVPSVPKKTEEEPLSLKRTKEI